MLLKPIYFGGLKIQLPLFMAPMAGITNMPFRIWIKKYGAGVVISEMISAKACIHKSPRTLEKMRIHHLEHPSGIQLFGDNAADMAEACKIALDMGADFININLGCPAPKVLKSGGGFALMSRSGKLATFFKTVVKNSPLPVTIKIRLGNESEPELYKIIARIAYESGIVGLVLHCRLKEQKHSGEAFYGALFELKNDIPIPIIANGGIDSCSKAFDVYKNTGCAGLMIGQGAVANPYIFSEIKNIFSNGSAAVKSRKSPIELFKQLLELNHKFYKNGGELIKLRKIFPNFTKGIKNSAAIRKNFFRQNDYSSMSAYINTLL